MVTTQKSEYFLSKTGYEFNLSKMVSDAVLAKRRTVAALHQLRGLSQSAIVREHPFCRRLVKRWMNVSYTGPASAFGRDPGVAKNAQVSQFMFRLHASIIRCMQAIIRMHARAQRRFGRRSHNLKSGSTLPDLATD